MLNNKKIKIEKSIQEINEEGFIVEYIEDEDETIEDEIGSRAFSVNHFTGERTKMNHNKRKRERNGRKSEYGEETEEMDDETEPEEDTTPYFSETSVWLKRSIVSFLGVDDLLNFRRVCKWTRDLSDEDGVKLNSYKVTKSEQLRNLNISSKTYVGRWNTNVYPGVLMSSLKRVYKFPIKDGYNCTINGKLEWVEGFFLNGVLNGRGVILSKDYEVDGEFKNGFYHGKCKFSKNGYSYDGNYAMGVKHGYGIMTINGDRYSGSFKKGIINGYGKLETKEFKYEGEFVDGKMFGRGLMKKSNGKVLEGSWANGTFKEGMLIDSFKNEFRGSFVNEILEGDGYVKLKNGIILNGIFRGNHLNGTGTIKHPNGIVFQGSFINGMLNGQGSVMRGSEIIACGDFKSNVLCGEGVQKNQNKLEIGQFDNGKMIKGKTIDVNGELMNIENSNAHFSTDGYSKIKHMNFFEAKPTEGYRLIIVSNKKMGEFKNYDSEIEVNHFLNLTDEMISNGLVLANDIRLNFKKSINKSKDEAFLDTLKRNGVPYVNLKEMKGFEKLIEKEKSRNQYLIAFSLKGLEEKRELFKRADIQESAFKIRSISYHVSTLKLTVQSQRNRELEKKLSLMKKDVKEKSKIVKLNIEDVDEHASFTIKEKNSENVETRSSMQTQYIDISNIDN